MSIYLLNVQEFWQCSDIALTRGGERAAPETPTPVTPETTPVPVAAPTAG